MKTVGRKRFAASVIGDKKYDSGHQDGKTSTKPNVKTMQATGQPKISSFFS